MTQNLSVDGTKEPGPAELAVMIGESQTSWDRLMKYLRAEYTPLSEKWHYSGQNFGWALRLMQRQRTVLYLVPRQGHFLVAFILGEDVIRAARQAGLQTRDVELIRKAPKFAEGKGVRLEVHEGKDLGSIKRLAAAKMAG
jgi:hypothetical protein